MESPTPYVSDLVLIGGGHAHVHVLKMLGMPKGRELVWQHGIRITLIARDVDTPYSGMLPGFVAGHYSLEDIHLDLMKLCQFSNIRLLHTSAQGIRYNDHQLQQQRNQHSNDHDHDKQSARRGGGWIECGDGRPPVRFDALSIDIGSVPSGTPPQFVTPVKPIGQFAAKFERLQENLIQTATSYSRENPLVVLVVGGGAGGIELSLSVKYSLQKILKAQEVHNEDALQVILVTRGSILLEQHNKGVRRIFQRILQERRIQVRYEAEAIDVKEVGVTSASKANGVSTKKILILSDSSKPQPPIFFDECLWCTSAGAPAWLANNTPFETTEDGFLTVHDTYECTRHPGVFAGGDCCHMVRYPRPKAGVFAVRAGPPLLENLLNYLTCRQPLQSHHPQHKFLSLISTGDPYAVASRGNWFAMEGHFLWTWKDYIDRQFMDKFKILPDLEEMMAKMKWRRRPRTARTIPNHVRHKGPDVMTAFAADPMRCGGCGAKVGATIVSRVLFAIHQRQVQRAAIQGSRRPPPPPMDHDDAAIVPILAGSSAMIHTIDYFRSFVSDPYLFGKIAAIHAMSDVHAMGANAQTALALAVVPFAADEEITESTLMDLLSGASDVLQDENVQLVGGHTCEGSELACGFAIQGYTPSPDNLFRKRGGRVGDKIVLTKPIGTGALFAANMRAKCQGHHVTEALHHMSQSNGPGSRMASAIGNERIHACTDVTGFGLVGHLLEMLITDPMIGAVLNIREIPFLKGALDASSHGIYSSLQPQNSRNRRAISNHTDAAVACPVEYPLLFDPQTAGGLLFFVDSDVADDFALKLQMEYPLVAVIGDIIEYRAEVNGVDGVCTVSSGGTKMGKRIHIRY